MNYFIKGLLVLCLIYLANCSDSNSATSIKTNIHSFDSEIPMDSLSNFKENRIDTFEIIKKVDDRNSIDSIVIGNETIVIRNDISNEVVKSSFDEKKRAEQYKNKCCFTLDKMDACCCTELISKYEIILIEDNLDSADSLKNFNPFYIKCLKENGSLFEDKILAVENDIWGKG